VVHMEDLKGRRETRRLSGLLPFPFDDRNL